MSHVAKLLLLVTYAACDLVPTVTDGLDSLFTIVV
jgi:hypothetical protein